MHVSSACVLSAPCTCLAPMEGRRKNLVSPVLCEQYMLLVTELFSNSSDNHIYSKSLKTWPEKQYRYSASIPNSYFDSYVVIKNPTPVIRKKTLFYPQLSKAFARAVNCCHYLYLFLGWFFFFPHGIAFAFVHQSCPCLWVVMYRAVGGPCPSRAKTAWKPTCWKIQFQGPSLVL